MNASDEALAKDARQGSVQAFDTLVRRNQRLVRGFLRRLASDAALADDLAQDTFLTAWRRIGAFDARGTFRGWLCRIAYTQFLQQRRSVKASIARETAAMQESETVGDDRSAAEARLTLDQVLTGLAPEQRAVLALCYGAGMSHSEAAEALNMPLGTVKSHVTRGRESVLARLGRETAS